MSKSILDLQPISRTRRNHGLEHATIHVLSKKFSNVKLGGMSSPSGFIIIGDVTTEDVAEAAIEALKKLRAGNAELALHPNCGTNFAISGIFAGMAAWLGALGAGKEFRRKLERLPLMIFLATLAVIITRPLGPLVQKQITTTGDPQGLELEKVETFLRAGVRLHRVITRG
jgi:plasmid stabilization system protein ParE